MKLFRVREVIEKLGGVENLRKNSLEQELMDYAHSISDDQAQFLRRLLDARVG